MICCSISFSFYNAPICKTNPQLFQGTKWRVADVRLQRIETGGAGLTFFSAYRLSKELLISRGKLCYLRVTSPAKDVLRCISDNLNADLGGQIRISGFWVGPDIEDGWGFVEAFVSQLP